MSKKILLIEDNLEMRENTAEILSLSEYSVITAENGKIGVELAKKEKPELIICDIMMPELDGYGVLHILSKNPETSAIPFIFLTAKADKNDLRKGMNLGADDYLTKPFDDVELLDAIESRLKKHAILKKEIQRNIEGINGFIDEVRGLEKLQSLSTKRSEKIFRKKDIIYTEGNYPNGIYFINKGKIKTFKTNEDGKEYIISLYKEGDFLGYSALLEDTKYVDSASVLEDSEVYHIPKEDFFSLLYNNKEVAQKFIKILSNDLLETEERLLKLAYNSVRKRVAEALLLLKDRYDNKEENTFVISISREDLANIVGTATESVIRTLSDFKEENLIYINKSQITLLDPEKLARMRN